MKRAAAKPALAEAEVMSAKQAGRALRRGAHYILVSVRQRPDSTVSPAGEDFLVPQAQETVSRDAIRTDSDGSAIAGAIKTPSSGGRGRARNTKRFANQKLRDGCKHHLAPVHPTEEGSIAGIERQDGDRDTGRAADGLHSRKQVAAAIHEKEYGRQRPQTRA